MRYFLISLFILFLGFFGVLEPARNMFQYVSSPIQVGLREFAIGLKQGFYFFTHLSSIRQENILLTEENTQLQSEILQLKKAERENIVLREQLKLKETLSFDKNLLLTNVMGNPNDLTGATFFLDKGSRHGVALDDNVIKGNYLVGKVIEVGSEKSLVELIISPNLSITVVDIDSSEKVEGIVVGRYGLSMEMLRILQGEAIKLGDIVVTSGKDGVFYPGLAVGKIIEVIEIPAEPLKSAYVEPLLSMSSLEKVFVVIDK